MQPDKENTCTSNEYISHKFHTEKPNVMKLNGTIHSFSDISDVNCNDRNDCLDKNAVS